MDTTPLAVPDASCDALHATTGRERADARAVAIPVVVAELRRLAVGLDGHSSLAKKAGDVGHAHGFAGAAWALRHRADEIERTRDGEAP